MRHRLTIPAARLATLLSLLLTAATAAHIFLNGPMPDTRPLIPEAMTAAMPDTAPVTPDTAAQLASLPTAPENTRPYRRADWAVWRTPIRPDGSPITCNARDWTIATTATPQADPLTCRPDPDAAWFDTWTGRIIRDPSRIDVDHVVALSEAEQSGNNWTDETRAAFAADPDNLAIASPYSNRSKGGRDAAEWLPPTNKCRYATIVVNIKTKYGLTIDPAERAALRKMIRRCNK